MPEFESTKGKIYVRSKRSDCEGDVNHTWIDP
jgi:hypothetical protein